MVATKVGERACLRRSRREQPTLDRCRTRLQKKKAGGDLFAALEATVSGEMAPEAPTPNGDKKKVTSDTCHYSHVHSATL